MLSKERMKGFKYVFVLLLCTCGMGIKAGAPADDFCSLRNTAYQAGEQLTFTVFYAVAGIYVNAGTAVFNNTLERLNGTPVYHITGDGKTNSPTTGSIPCATNTKATSTPATCCR
jgi:hypothetical protein